MNLLRTYENLPCKRELYRFSDQRDPSIHTDKQKHTQIDILLFYYKVCKLIDCRDGGGRLSLGGRLEGAQDQRKKTDDDRRRSDLHICLFRNRDTALERNLFI